MRSLKKEKYIVWYSLIKHFKEENAISNGLTIPFLLGAIALLNKEIKLNENSISSLLYEIAESETELNPVLQKCTDIKEYVISLRTKEFCRANFKSELVFKNTVGENSLFVSQNAASLGKNIDEISENLEKIYASALRNKKYSWKGFGETWEEFNEKEIELINSSK